VVGGGGGGDDLTGLLDVVVSKLFKDYLKQLYHEWLLTADLASGPTARMKKPSLAILSLWIIRE